MQSPSSHSADPTLQNNKISEINQENFKKFFEFINRQAKMLSVDYSNEKRPKNKLFGLNFFGKSPKHRFEVYKINGEIVFYNPLTKLRYHFNLDDENQFGTNLEDFLVLK